MARENGHTFSYGLCNTQTCRLGGGSSWVGRCCSHAAGRVDDGKRSGCSGHRRVPGSGSGSFLQLGCMCGFHRRPNDSIHALCQSAESNLINPKVCRRFDDNASAERIWNGAERPISTIVKTLSKMKPGCSRWYAPDSRRFIVCRRREEI